jgi:hypothetical protein
MTLRKSVFWWEMYGEANTPTSSGGPWLALLTTGPATAGNGTGVGVGDAQVRENLPPATSEDSGSHEATPLRSLIRQHREPGGN